MADKKISELTLASALTGVEQFPLVQSGSTKKGLLSQVLTYIQDNLVFSGDINGGGA